MQEITFETPRGEEITREFFNAKADMFDEMKSRLAAFEERPETEGTVIKVMRRKIGRNDPCPCGSNLKFKKCCISKCT